MGKDTAAGGASVAAGERTAAAACRPTHATSPRAGTREAPKPTPGQGYRAASFAQSVPPLLPILPHRATQGPAPPPVNPLGTTFPA